MYDILYQSIGEASLAYENIRAEEETHLEEWDRYGLSVTNFKKVARARKIHCLIRARDE